MAFKLSLLTIVESWRRYLTAISLSLLLISTMIA